jgi:hypothetical protein
MQEMEIFCTCKLHEQTNEMEKYSLSLLSCKIYVKFLLGTLSHSPASRAICLWILTQFP